jgi:acetyl-CoA synthetase (ADP-forming)
VILTAKGEIAEILDSVKNEDRRELLELEAKRVLRLWGIPVNRTELAKNVDDAIRTAREIHYPVVLKIASPDILHKSDAKGVKVGIGSELELRQAFKEIMENASTYNPRAKILGVTVQEHLPSAREAIVGGFQDKSFGPTVMFGLGGIWVEILQDTSFRLAPLTREEAKEMMKEIKGYPVLAGRRGEPPADIESLAEIIEKTGKLVAEFPQISELDINPIFVFKAGEGATAVDARIVLGDGT